MNGLVSQDSIAAATASWAIAGPPCGRGGALQRGLILKNDWVGFPGFRRCGDFILGYFRPSLREGAALPRGMILKNDWVGFPGFRRCGDCILGYCRSSLREGRGFAAWIDFER